MLYLSCWGTGLPTILLEARDECELFQWSRVVGDLIGRSDPATLCRGLDDLLGDLEALLEVA